MGLFDSIAGAVMGKVLGGEQGNMVQVALDLVNQHGGIAGVIEQFKASGLSEQVASWIGTGENLPISAEQIAQVLGSTQVGEIAEKVGLSREALTTQLADYLPNLVDKLSPDGVLPSNNAELMSRVMSLLK